MTDNKTNTSRRNVLKGLAVLPLAVVLARHGNAMAENVSVDDPMAKALAYTEKSTEAGKHCSNCKLWQGGKAERGGCTIFGTKQVAAAGWCKSWVAAG